MLLTLFYIYDLYLIKTTFKESSMILWLNLHSWNYPYILPYYPLCLTEFKISAIFVKNTKISIIYNNCRLEFQISEFLKFCHLKRCFRIQNSTKLSNQIWNFGSNSVPICHQFPTVEIYSKNSAKQTSPTTTESHTNTRIHKLGIMFFGGQIPL